MTCAYSKSFMGDIDYGALQGNNIAINIVVPNIEAQKKYPLSTDTDDEKRWLITTADEGLSNEKRWLITTADEGLSKCTRFMLRLKRKWGNNILKKNTYQSKT